MKRMFAALLVLIAAGAGSAQAQGLYDCQNIIGIYTSPAPTFENYEALSCYQGAPGQIAAYVVLTHPWSQQTDAPITAIGGFEFKLGLPANVFLLGAVLPPGTTNFATSPEFLCGANIPVVDDRAVLLTLNLGEFSMTPSQIFITPVEAAPQSVPGNIAITDYHDDFRISTAGVSSGDFASPVFGLWACPVLTQPPCELDVPDPPVLRDPLWSVTIHALGDTVLAGVHPDATDWYDADFDEPEAGGALTMPRPDWHVDDAVNFKRDVRLEFDPADEARTWRFRVDSSARPLGDDVTVAFAPDGALAGVPLLLTDLAAGVAVEIGDSLLYTFAADGAAREFDLRIGLLSAPAGPVLVTFGGVINGMADVGNVVTSSPDATDGYDPGVDIPEPSPPPANHLTVSVEHVGWLLGKRYQRDVVGAYDALVEPRTWTILVETDQVGQVLLEFLPNFARDSAIALVLRDLETGQAYSLFPALTYVFDTSGPTVRRFELTVGGRSYPTLTPDSREIAPGWSLVAPPVQPAAGADDLDAVILDGIPGHGFVFSYAPAVGYERLAGTATAASGDGFWLATDTGFTWTLDGDLPVTGVTVPLDPGWNLTGYPMWFNGPVEGIRVLRSGLTLPWLDAVAAGWVAPVMDYDAIQDDYLATADLQSWHGYWIAALEPDVRLFYDWPHFQDLPLRYSKLRGAVKLAPADSWRCELAVDDGSGRLRKAVIGAESGATDGYDGLLDLPRPPASPQGGSSITLLRPEWDLTSGPALAADIVAPLEGRKVSWRLSLARGEPGAVTLSWTTDGWPDDLDFQIYLPRDNRVVVMSMRERDSVVLPVGSQPLELVVRTPDLLSGETMVPFAGYSLRTHPNPFNPKTTITFALPRDGRAEVRIYSVRGELVDVLGGRVLAAGPRQFTWRGTDRAGRAVPSGSYFARLLVDGEHVGQTAKMSLIR